MDKPDNTKEKVGRDIMDQVRQLNAEWEKAKKTGKQLGLGLEPDDMPNEDPGGLDFLKDVQNPDKAHELNYAIRRELMNNLPPGKQWKPLRDFIYEEKNIFLRRGKMKKDASWGVIGADSRQAFLHHFQVALDVVRKWAAKGGTPVEIFFEFYELNRQAGYRPKVYDGPLAITGTLDDVFRARLSGKPFDKEEE